MNCAFVRLATSVGYDKVIAMAHAMGVTKDNLLDILNLTLGYPGAEHRDHGVGDGHHRQRRHVPRAVRDPEGRRARRQGRVRRERTRDPGASRPRSQRASRTCCAGSSPAGPGTAANVAGHSMFGKTGTTDQRADAWFIGATPQLATAVWFGNYKNNAGGAGFGGVSAAPVFHAFMSQALAGKPDHPAA